MMIFDFYFSNKIQSIAWLPYIKILFKAFPFLFLEAPKTIKKGNKYGFINTLGEEIVPCIYDKVYPFTEYGKASVIKNGKSGYVLKDGTEKIIE